MSDATNGLVEKLRGEADFIDRDTYDECWEVRETPKGKMLRQAADRIEALEESAREDAEIMATLQQNEQDAMERLKEATDYIAELEAERAKLIEALKPFAQAARSTEKWPDAHGLFANVRIGDLRRAAALVTP